MDSACVWPWISSGKPNPSSINKLSVVVRVYACFVVLFSSRCERLHLSVLLDSSVLKYACYQLHQSCFHPFRKHLLNLRGIESQYPSSSYSKKTHSVCQWLGLSSCLRSLTICLFMLDSNHIDGSLFIILAKHFKAGSWEITSLRKNKKGF